VLQAQSDSPQQHEIREFEIVEVRDLRGKKKTGRPPRLTKARFDRMLDLIRAGNTNTASCRIENVAYTTWREHIRRKPEWRAELVEAEKIRDEVWKDFALETIRLAMPKSWQAGMTFLERKYPLEYSLRVPNRPTTEPDVPEPPLPAQILQEHRRLTLELLREDSEKATHP
jgi:hypothetical protein